MSFDKKSWSKEYRKYYYKNIESASVREQRLAKCKERYQRNRIKILQRETERRQIAFVSRAAHAMTQTDKILCNYRDLLNKLTPAEISYIAGIVDGEGCITISRGRNRATRGGYDYRGVICITNTSLKLMDWISERIDAKYYGRENGGKLSIFQKKIFNIVLQGTRSYVLADFLLPFLVIKKDKAACVIELHSTGHYTGVTIPDAEIERRKAVWEKFRALDCA